MKLFNLVKNEMIKIIFKKKLLIIIGILVVLSALFSYGQTRVIENNRARIVNLLGEAARDNWKEIANQRLMDLKNRLNRSFGDEGRERSIRLEIERLDYFIENDINPYQISGAKFSADFMERGIFLLIPLLIVIISADLVS